jgi:GAF domain
LPQTSEFQSDPQGEVPTFKQRDPVKNWAADPPPIPGTPTGPDQPDYHSQAERDSEVNKELRRLNRALRALSASNQALARATSEQELLNLICDVIVRLGKYRLAWIGYALLDEEKTLRPMAIAGDDDGYVARALVTWSDAPAGREAMGTAIRENRWCVIRDIQTDPRFEPWREWGQRMG